MTANQDASLYSDHQERQSMPPSEIDQFAVSLEQRTPDENKLNSLSILSDASSRCISSDLSETYKTSSSSLSLFMDRCIGSAAGWTFAGLALRQIVPEPISYDTLNAVVEQRASLLEQSRLQLNSHTRELRAGISWRQPYLTQAGIEDWPMRSRQFAIPWVRAQPLSPAQLEVHAEWSALKKLVADLEKETRTFKAGSEVIACNSLHSFSRFPEIKSAMKDCNEAKFAYEMESFAKGEMFARNYTRHLLGTTGALIVGELGKNVFDSGFGTHSPVSLRTTLFDAAAPAVLLLRSLPWYLKGAAIVGVHAANRLIDGVEHRSSSSWIR
jgi:hypothetical protein